LKALIIAAGSGQRMGKLTQKKPKPLLPFLGLSFIERAILTAKEAGIKEFIIVVGYQAEKIKQKLKHGENYQVKIQYVVNPQWKEENGTSVLAAKELLETEDKFLLLMADHIFSPTSLTLLQKFPLQSDECVLGVDLKEPLLTDPQEATKVQVEGGKVKAIGKNLSSYQGLDCGIFLCTPVIFPALEEGAALGETTLSAGMNVLAGQGRLRICELSGHLWADLDTPAEIRKAERYLLKKAGKAKDGFVSRFFNRYFSRWLTKLVINTPLTPNWLSVFSGLIGLGAGFCFWQGNNLLAGLLAQFCSITDGVDGEVARLKFQASKYGAYFDAILDRYVDTAILLGMTYQLWQMQKSFFIFLLGFLALTGSFMSMLGEEKFQALQKNNPLSPEQEARLKFLSYFRLSRDVRYFLIMLGGIFNQILGVLVLLTITSHLGALIRLGGLRKVLN
jgi:CDP-L-myo-inositol myo-inositolphosphotransferase